MTSAKIPNDTTRPHSYARLRHLGHHEQPRRRRTALEEAREALARSHPLDRRERTRPQAPSTGLRASGSPWSASRRARAGRTRARAPGATLDAHNQEAGEIDRGGVPGKAEAFRRVGGTARRSRSALSPLRAVAHSSGLRSSPLSWPSGAERSLSRPPAVFSRPANPSRTSSVCCSRARFSPALACEAGSTRAASSRTA